MYRRLRVMVRKFLRPGVLAVAAAVWLIATVAGLGRLVVYSQTPGVTGAVPVVWPGGDALSRRPGTPTLVLALHPACPCSRATIGQIDRLLADHPGAFDVVALLAHYDALPEGDDIIGPALARRPAIRRIDDRDAAIARRFGALTSGHAILYDETGRLRFSGGLTRARGEGGESVPLTWLRAWAAGTRPASAATFSVFGCALSHGAES